MNDLSVKIASSKEIIFKAVNDFGQNLYALSSFGADSAVMLQLLQIAKVDIKIITIDTGFLFDETIKFKEDLESNFDLDIITVGPNQNEIEEIVRTNMWSNDKDRYHSLVKLKPLEKAIKKFEIKGLVSGVRHDQTRNRSKLNAFNKGLFGEVRVYPIIEWNQEDIEEFIKLYNLPRHPLFGEYASIGDWTTTRPGNSRKASRNLKDGECGLIVAEGKIVNTKG